MTVDGTSREAPSGAKVPGELSSQISRTMVMLYREVIGRGPTKARTTANVNTILVAFEDTMTVAEKSLMAEGEDSQVVAIREALGNAMRPRAIAAIESLIGRTVRSYISGFDPDADVAVAVFLLEQIPESGELGVSEADGDGKVERLA